MAQTNVMEIAPITLDKRYQLCAGLMRQSKSDNERYGCIIVKDGAVVGTGQNRAISHPHFRLEREIRQGYSNHAEIEGLNDVLMKTKRRSDALETLKDADIFVSGYFPRTKQLFFHDRYTCIRCPPHMRRFDIRSVNIPLPTRWVRKGVDDALKEAREFTNGTHRKRLVATVGSFSIDRAVGVHTQELAR